MGEGGSTAFPRLAPASAAAASLRTRPALDDRPPVGIVHLGIGAFARAHQALHTVRALEHEPGPWGICGVAPRRRAAIDALAPQDGLYAVVERRADGDTAEVLALLRGVIPGAEAPARIADPAVHVVTLTITERGYPRDGAGGLADDDAIRADLAGEAAPVTALGQLTRGLQARMENGEAGGITVISCDNVPRNGRVLERLVQDFCARLPGREGEALTDWVSAHVRFPCTMVDRVVPTPSPRDRETVRRLLAVDDHAAVAGEPFSQWVLEDAFAGPRPAWELGGVQIVADSAPWELLKLRLLNASHCGLAYLGGPHGATTVEEALRLDAVAGAVRHLLLDDLAPTVPAPPGVSVEGYVEEFLARFANPRLGHPLQQIAADGSEKLAARIFPAARERLRAGEEPHWIALVVAAWARHVDGGPGPEVRDAHAPRLREALVSADGASPERRAAAFLGVREVFGEELGESPVFRALVADGLARLDAGEPES
ncbi:MAG: mannitol dehydrogenase family protein [Gemmatimonadaceae bacterium]